MLSSLFFLIPHSWKTGRCTHCHPAGAATSCSFVSMLNWSKNLFSPRLQGSWAVKHQLKHDRAQRQPRCKGTEEPFHPAACESCSFFVCSLLATLSDDYLENSFKTPSAGCQQKRFKNLSFHWTQPRESPPQQTQSLTQSGHIKTLLLSLICTNFGPNPWTDITGLQTTPRTLNGAAKAGGGWAINCSAPGTGSTSGTGFSPCKPAQDLLLGPSNTLSDSFCKLVPAVLPLCGFGSCITF